MILNVSWSSLHWSSPQEFGGVPLLSKSYRMWLCFFKSQANVTAWHVGTLSLRNASDVIEQISPIKLYMFFASDFKLSCSAERFAYNVGNETTDVVVEVLRWVFKLRTTLSINKPQRMGTRLYHTTLPIKSIRRSRVTGPLNLTKSHRGHTKIMKNLKKSSKREENFLQITIIISEYSNSTKP